jgi:renal tumor antigen
MLYELLTTKPMFPGKHEIDQIGRIHNVLGTPSRDLLAQFKQNPNTQISFAFPQRVPQDLRKFLPRVSAPTIQLLAGLLTYNPRNRLSAADALNFDCFTLIREVEQEWEQLDTNIAFPLFYLQRAALPRAPVVPHPRAAPAPHQSNLEKPPEPEDSQKVPDTVEKVPSVPQFVPPENLPVHNEAVYAAPGPEILVSKPVYRPPPEPPLKAIPLVVPPPVAKPFPVLGVSKPPVYPVDATLIESRMKAALRIKAYQDAAKAKKPKKPMPLHGAAFQFASSKALFPKPRPDLVEPRLPKLMF